MFLYVFLVIIFCVYFIEFVARLFFVIKREFFSITLVLSVIEVISSFCSDRKSAKLFFFKNVNKYISTEASKYNLKYDEL